MLLRKKSDPSVLGVGDRVVAVEPVGAIPEGTRGRIKLVDGFLWVRYWVAWETGEWTGSVDGASIVNVARLDRYRQERAQAAERAASDVARPAVAAPVAAGEAAGGGGSKIPEHLVERARQARERKAAQAAG